ncbi:MAG: hypothetical protein KDC38_02250 [Planctomycetes bacterium]|nr:hypothetical protein [Planctomycetota bacterium]
MKRSGWSVFRQILPPNRVWAAGQAAVLLAAGIHLALHLRLDEVTRDARAQVLQSASRPSRPIQPLAGPDADLLRRVCPRASSESLAALAFSAAMSSIFDQHQLEVKSSRVVELGDSAPRRRFEWRLSGTAEGLVRSLSAIIRVPAPIVVHHFRWWEGDGASQRHLDLVIDFYLGAEAP